MAGQRWMDDKNMNLLVDKCNIRKNWAILVLQGMKTRKARDELDKNTNLRH